MKIKWRGRGRKLENMEKKLKSEMIWKIWKKALFISIITFLTKVYHHFIFQIISLFN
jgi:hypothetical protein